MVVAVVVVVVVVVMVVVVVVVVVSVRACVCVFVCVCVGGGEVTWVGIRWGGVGRPENELGIRSHSQIMARMHVGAVL